MLKATPSKNASTGEQPRRCVVRPRSTLSLTGDDKPEERPAPQERPPQPPPPPPFKPDRDLIGYERKGDGGNEIERR
jgi:hypothetical protein